MSEIIETIEDGYLKRNFISIPAATSAMTLQEAMKRSLEVYQKRKAKLDAYAKKPKADKAYIQEIHWQLQADVDLYNSSAQMINDVDDLEKQTGREVDHLNERLILALDENVSLLNQVVALRVQLSKLKVA
jgi:hypothetical protein